MLALRNAVTYVDDKGVKRQTQMLEFDIQKTKDNHLVDVSYFPAQPLMQQAD